MFLLQEYSRPERTFSTYRAISKSIYSSPRFAGPKSAEHVRALNSLNVLKDGAKGNEAINNYSNKCWEINGYKLLRGLTQSLLPGYSQTRSFHQDHCHWSDAKKEGPDTSKKHKQMVNESRNEIASTCVLLLF